MPLYTARPTIRINGAEQERVTGLLIGMEMTEREDGLSTLELTLDNIASDGSGDADFAFEDEATFKLGDTVTVYCGEESTPTEIFRGIISALEAEFSEEGTPRLLALAEDTLQKARIKRRTRTYDDQTIADIARSMASDLGLTPQIDGFTDDHRHAGAVERERPGVSPPSAGAVRRRPAGRRHRAARVAAQRRPARHRGAGSAQPAPPGDHAGGPGASGERGDGHRLGSGAGPAHHQPKLGTPAGARQRTTGHAICSPTPSARRTHQIGHLVVKTDDEGRALADASFGERQRRFVTASGTAEGNPAIRAGTHVRLTGLSPRFNNTYYVTHCCHRFDLERGYETDFTAESAFLGQP